MNETNGVWEKKTMNTKATKSDEGAQLRSEQCRKWNVILDGEIIGSVHGATRQQAEDTVRILRNPKLTVEEA